MGNSIAHRGPDGEGTFVDGPVALSHRRLAIIDLSEGGAQPMTSSDGRYVIVYNGELYNYRELRDDLIARGHKFRSASDTEVMLAAWSEWQFDALRRFNGMFAFALWDRAERKLWLARDRYGVKPLYKTRAAGYVLFGSEIKALLAHGALRARLDAPALVEYLTFQNFFSGRTLFDGVELVPAGCAVEIRSDGRETLRRWWDFSFEEPTNACDQREYEEELDRLFVQAVKRQMVADVPVSAYLSGGIDSGAITAVAARLSPDLNSFTVGFDMSSVSGLELGYDERAAAERLSYLLKTEHYQMVLKAGDMERCMSRLVWHLEEPRVGQSYPNYYASKLASRFGKVVLAGTGSDEIFGGYPWRYYRAVVNDDFEDYIDKYYLYWQRLIPNTVIQKVMAPVWSEVSYVWTRDIMRDVYFKHANELTRPEDYINHSLYLEAKTFMHGLLVVEDKLSMAHGLETRVPFLDNDLVDFGMKLPVRFKLGNLGEVVQLNENDPGGKSERYFNRTNDGKLMLRHVLERYVPEEIARAEKKGFSAPDATWFRGESIDYVRERLLSNSARIYDVLDYKAIAGLIQDHMEGRQNRRLLIWSLLYLEEWFRAFMKAPAEVTTVSDVVHV